MRQGSVAAGVTFLLLVAGFVIYSVFIKDWCEQHKRGWGGGRAAWGQRNYGEPPGDCVREKSLFSF